jgi:hypothetical protein
MTNKEEFCCKEFRFAYEHEQGIKKQFFGDKEYYCYDVLYNKPQYEEIDGELKIVTRTFKTIIAILHYCNFCGAKLDK